ncbi:PREDICTED: ATP synthase subunit s-like protein [Polistes dominula]|uniref:ATP synthase subunit s-like protein n=1 Tax=Polistes dominula TaxID=743375 RepID=A0ABM1J0D0_POLDO|nr:PREDICTED: ATP synthase subunit s-like protein [Polistes dominula]
MLSQYLINKLIKTSHVVSVKSLQHISTGSKLMERVPRNLKDCSRFIPKKTQISSEDTEPSTETDTSFSWFQPEVQPVQKFSIGNIKQWFEFNKKAIYSEEQQVDPKMINVLGINITAAYFIIKWRGKIKFKNSNWLEATDDKPVRLPTQYKSNYVVIAIDASKTMICYEGLENMSPLNKLKWLSFKGCEYIDDWCLDRISARYPSLEFLDISDCKNVTEKGLEALYKLDNLKMLVVTNHHKSAAFELTCFMLEECMPNLECKILNSWYADKSKESKDENKELE